MLADVVADNLLEAADLVLNPGSDSVAAVPLPSPAPGLGDRVDVLLGAVNAVGLRTVSSRGGTGDVGGGMALMHGGIDGGGTVVSAVPGERSHRSLDLIERRRDFGGIVTVVIGQGGARPRACRVPLCARLVWSCRLP
ncbi:hypothetical protein D3877_25410 [Azospirillum cavernae]|uniref:Uncharacterized protein n=1 Tax=Azospirillum cavernae TaxID=2320860 RepID=A0A418VQ81_9PROT|nr:hypothetical protein D3877_25410 [Azospirillum cavernae]